MLLIYPVVAGLLFALAFTPWGNGLFSSIAIASLLVFHGKCLAEKSNLYFIKGSLLSFLVFNAIACGWINFASVFGGVGEIVVNSFFMLVPWFLYLKAYDIKGRAFAKLILFSSWLAFEFVHTNWELQWPWLHLGNAFGFSPSLVQWYKYTGVGGGTMWVLLGGLSLHALYCRFTEHAGSYAVRSEIAIAVMVFSIPMSISFLMPSSGGGKTKNLKVAVVQPNFDPYAKDGLSVSDKMERLLSLSEKECKAGAGLVLWPEVAIPVAVFEDKIYKSTAFQKIFALSERYPSVDFIVGGSSFRYYPNQDSASASARSLEDGGYYDSFNTIFQVSNGRVQNLRHKSKLVIGVEKLPFPGLMQLFSGFIESLGGYAASLGADDFFIPFVLNGGDAYGGYICYESVFGSFVSHSNVSLIGIHTNDGWWKESLGHRQHFAYASLRAIENQSYVARSAYTGISGFIAPDGKVLSKLEYNTQGSLSWPIPIMTEQSFYSVHGDFIGRWALFFSVLLGLYLFVQAKSSMLK